jgi:hypothetical protein
MRWACVLALVAACGSDAGADARDVCARGGKLCDAPRDEIAKCEKQVADLKKDLGDHYGKTMSCAREAKSCAEFAGCFVGGLGGELGDVLQDFGEGMRKGMGAPAGGGSVDLAACKRFQGGDSSATWDGCTDGVKRELRCEPFMDSLQCNCLENGAETWFFDATSPPLRDRAAATQLAQASCKMGFGN